jgi:NAD(P)-dependent dehydrogenase (short-subunit alcohol dehydrogenase family)
MWDLGLAGKTVLVTGGSSGIGLSVAIEASRNGARVGIVGRDPLKLDKALGEFSGRGHWSFPCDLSNTENLGLLGSRVAENLGPLDGIVHAAGTYQARPLRLVDAETINEVFSLNFLAPTLLTKLLIQQRLGKPNVSVVFLGSVSSLRGQPGASSYSASKGAVNSLVRSLAAEFGGGGVRINSIIAGLVDTDLSRKMRGLMGEISWDELVTAHPLGIGKPIDIANSVLFLLSDKSRWITGTELVVDGGYLAC